MRYVVYLALILVKVPRGGAASAIPTGNLNYKGIRPLPRSAG